MKQREQPLPGSGESDRWESLVDRIIQEAQASGAFDDLPGAGKSLELHQDPHTPREWRLAFHVLQNAGYKPAWIELRESIEAELETARDACRRSLAIVSDLRAKQAALDRFRHELESINRRIDDFNLQVPLLSAQLRRATFEHELRQFDSEARE